MLTDADAVVKCWDCYEHVFECHRCQTGDGCFQLLTDLNVEAQGASYEVDSIVDRYIPSEGWHHRKYLIRWKGFSEEHDEWHNPKDLSEAQESMEEYDRQNPAPGTRNNL